VEILFSPEVKIIKIEIQDGQPISRKAFYEYFFNRVQEPYPSISKKPKNRKNEFNQIFFYINSEKEKENHWMIELSKITKKIT
jgi:hypothetical protein